MLLAWPGSQGRHSHNSVVPQKPSHSLLEKLVLTPRPHSCCFCKRAEVLLNKHYDIVRWSQPSPRSSLVAGTDPRGAYLSTLRRTVRLAPTVDFLCSELVWHAQAARTNMSLKEEIPNISQSHTLCRPGLLVQVFPGDRFQREDPQQAQGVLRSTPTPSPRESPLLSLSKRPWLWPGGSSAG